MPVLCWWHACADNTNLAENCDISHKLQFFCAFAFFLKKNHSRVHEWNLLFAQCQWGLMRDGIKSSSISLTLQGEPMEPTMWRRCVCKCMPIVAFAASTSLIDFTLRRNYPLNSSFSYPSKYECFFWLNSPYIQENNDLCSLWNLGFYMLHVILYLHMICNPRSNNKSQQQFFL